MKKTGWRYWVGLMVGVPSTIYYFVNIIQSEGGSRIGQLIVGILGMLFGIWIMTMDVVYFYGIHKGWTKE